MDVTEPSGDRTGASPDFHDARVVRVAGLIGWAAIFGVFLLWEGLGLTMGQHWPTLSHMLRAVTRPLPGRLFAFGLWLWIGWHLFIRGWNFFLRGPLPEGPAAGGAGPMSLGQLWQHAILPLTGVYALFLAMLAFVPGRKSSLQRDEAVQEAMPLGRVLLGIALAVAVGYVSFVALIAGYVLLAGKDPAGLLLHAIKGGSVLAFGVAVPGFVFLTLVARLTRRLRR